MAVNLVEKIDGDVKIRHVLASVSDKTGLELIIPGLVKINPDIVIYSTGGTYNSIKDILGNDAAGRNLVQVSDYTGQPEMQGGLVKTLDFKIYLGLLSETYNEAHRADLKRVSGSAIDMAIVNLYPFKATIAKADCTLEQARANIDIGGPCMVRASAKNFLRVASVTDPSDYPRILSELALRQGAVSLKLRFELARKAFAHTADYDKAIAGYLASAADDSLVSVYNVQNA